MKKKVNQLVPVVEQQEEVELITMANGAKRHPITGKIVAGAALTRDMAIDMVKSRVERKRAIVAAAARDAVQSQTLNNKYGDESWLAEVTQAQMMIATTPDSGKAAVMAASWLVDNTGMGERQAQQDIPQTVTHTIDPAVVELLRRVAAAQQDDTYTNAIDADVTE